MQLPTIIDKTDKQQTADYTKLHFKVCLIY